MDVLPFTVKRKGHDLWKKKSRIIFIDMHYCQSHNISSWGKLVQNIWTRHLNFTDCVLTYSFEMNSCNYNRILQVFLYIYIYKPAVEVSFNVPKPQKNPQRTNPLKCLRNEKSLKIDVNIDYRHVCYYPEQLSMQETAVILPITYTEFIVCTSEFLTSWSARVFGVAWLLSSQKGADRQGRRMAMEINSPLSNKLDH